MQLLSYNKPTYPECFIKNNKRNSNKKDIANGFNNFFTNVGPILAKHISLPEDDATLYDYLERKKEHTMFLSPVDDLELIRTVHNFKSKISTDYSDINMSLIKKVITKIIRPFSHICNVSFQTGVFPSKSSSTI